MVHFSYNREESHIFGSSLWLPVLPDILALRRLEEDAEQLVHNHAFPLLLYKIGDDKYPAEDAEIADRESKINNMESGDIIVATHREDLQSVAQGKGGISAEKYLEYFEARVLAGLNISSIELGRGATANRGTATQLVQQRVEQCKDFQRVVADIFNNHLFPELLAEGGFNATKYVSDTDLAQFKFNEIDMDEQIKWHNHIADLWNKNFITLDQARTLADMDPQIDEKRLYIEMVTRKEIEFKAGLKTDSINRPENQYGKKLSNPSTANDK
jgi:hypothetical protein